jgi:hypothetical protein
MILDDQEDNSQFVDSKLSMSTSASTSIVADISVEERDGPQ